MKLSKVAIWSSLPLTLVGLLASFLIAAAGAGHGDKSSILFIFPGPALLWPLCGFEVAVLAALVQFPAYALAIHVASRHHLEWIAAGAVLILHFGVAAGFWGLTRLS